MASIMIPFLKITKNKNKLCQENLKNKNIYHDNLKVCKNY